MVVANPPQESTEPETEPVEMCSELEPVCVAGGAHQPPCRCVRAFGHDGPHSGIDEDRYT